MAWFGGMTFVENEKSHCSIFNDLRALLITSFPHETFACTHVQFERLSCSSYLFFQSPLQKAESIDGKEKRNPEMTG